MPNAIVTENVPNHHDVDIRVIREKNREMNRAADRRQAVESLVLERFDTYCALQPLTAADRQQLAAGIIDGILATLRGGK
jgi:hypothetical protein